MIDEILLRIFVNQTAVLVIVGLLLMGLAELGYRFGRATSRRDADAAKGHSGSIQGAILGLLGLLLGFTFAMSVSRHDTRRQIIVDEANTIGTTWLRADFLPGGQRDEVRKLLIEYAELHLEQFRHDADTAAFVEVRGRISELHRELWRIGVAGAKLETTPLTNGFITSLNETIDLDATRMAARQNYVPGAVWLLLLVVAGCGAWSSGFVGGAGSADGGRSLFSQMVFPLLIAVVIMLISDIDRPRRGLISISQQPFIDLLETMRSDSR
jgi:hypothetical protein